MNADLRTTAWRRGARTIKKIRPRPAVAAGGLAAAAVLTASLAGAPFAQASVASAGPAVTGHTVETNGPAAAYAAHVRAYWTRDRMLSARNADAVASKSAHVKNPGAGTREPGKTGQPGHVAGTAPTQRLGGGIKSVPQSHRATPAYGSSGTVWPGSPYLPPATTTGKVFFTTNAGGQTEDEQTRLLEGLDGCLFLAEVSLGLLSRAAPSLNVFSLAFPLRVVVALIVVALAVPLISPAVGNLVHDAMAPLGVG